MKIFIIIIIIVVCVGLALGLYFGLLKTKSTPAPDRSGVVEKTLDAPSGSEAVNGISINTTTNITRVVVTSNSNIKLLDVQKDITKSSSLCFDRQLTIAYYPIKVSLYLKDVEKEYTISVRLINTC